MDACCETKAEELSALHDEHKKILIIVLVINAALFIVEAAAGLIAYSNKLQHADSDYGYYFCKHAYMPALRLQ